MLGQRRCEPGISTTDDVGVMAAVSMCFCLAPRRHIVKQHACESSNLNGHARREERRVEQEDGKILGTARASQGTDITRCRDPR